MLRQYLPKNADLSALTQDDVDAIAAKLNHRPRRVLGWATPAEALGLLEPGRSQLTWDTIDDAPLLQVVDWAGATWTTRAETEDAPQAVGAHTAQDGSLNVLVVTGDAVMESTDGAATFAPLVVR